MILDLSFRNVIQKFFESCKIEMYFINVSTYYLASMKKNPLTLVQKGIREIDILLTAPAMIKNNGTVALAETVILFFDENIMKEAVAKENYNLEYCHLIKKSAIWAVMSVWKLTTPDGSIFYTYRDVNEIGLNSILKMI